MKVFKKSKRHLAKYKKAKPNVRLSVTKKEILEQQQIQAYSRMKRRERLTELRTFRVEHLGSNLIKAREWGYARKWLQGKDLEEQKEIADLWAEGQCRMRGIEKL